MNLPNMLTILRVIMIPLFVIAMLCDFPEGFPDSDIMAGCIFITACVTDFFDGYLARKYNQITTFGKFMDPLADKLLVCAALICFLADEHPEIPAWVVIVIISREFIISGFRLVAAEKGVTIAASWWGKVKTCAQMLMALLLIFHFEHPVFRTIDTFVVYAALVLTVLSLVDYIYRNRGVMRDIE